MEERSKILRYNQFSNDVKKSINSFTSKSTVALIGYDKNDFPIKGLLASGSFVVINNIYGVLTANHVWKNFIERSTYTSFCILDRAHYIHERTDYLKSYSPQNDIDICFIELPPTILGTIKAASIFHPVLTENLIDIDIIRKNTCVTVGFPYEMQSFEDRKTHLFGYYTHISNYRKISDDWDIIELNIETDQNNYALPKSFGGMSGGGIWSLKCYFNDDNGETKYFIKYNPKDSFIAGVNYYQEVTDGKITQIYGVGPISIYSGMVKLVSG